MLPGAYSDAPSSSSPLRRKKIIVILAVILVVLLVFLWGRSHGMLPSSIGRGSSQFIPNSTPQTESVRTETSPPDSPLHSSTNNQQRPDDSPLITEANPVYTTPQEEVTAQPTQTAPIAPESPDESEAMKPEVTTTGSFITVMISTVSRRENYLEQTLFSFLSQLPPPSIRYNPFVNSIKFVVMNNNPKEKRHDHFENLKLRCANEDTVMAEKCRKYVRFESLGARKLSASDKQDSHRKVKQQTADITMNLKMLQEHLDINPSQYFIVMEDDWEFCVNAWIALLSFISKVESQFTLSQWIALRFSYGLNGILFQGSDINDLHQYFKAHINSSSPPDHLVYHFMKDHHNKGRSIVVYRHNLYNHIGIESSLFQRTRSNPGCFGYMYDWLQPLEIFNNDKCPFDDISPCPQLREDTRLIDFDHVYTDIHRKHYPFCNSPVKDEEEAIKKSCRIRPKK